MLFSSTIFLFVFLPAVLFLYYRGFKKLQWRNYFLLFVSLFFYAWGEPIYVLLMLFSISSNFLLGLQINRTEGKGYRRFWLTVAVFINLALLFHYKYLHFVTVSVNSLLGTQIPTTVRALPIGISFFTFQAMSYVIDVYRKQAQVQRNPFYLALYISFFPQLIAGPIVRYNTIEQQILDRTVTAEKFQSGVIRFIQGFAKKVLLSNILSLTAEHTFAAAAEMNLTVLMAWLGSLAYTFQIFFDFSGYSDMAIGLGRMFGFEFEENFRYPYLSKSISEFWNRWHISLGHWFRDYVYFPLGGSRVSRGKLLRNLFVVWLLTGIWHGAAWQFLLWGLIYGVLISLEKCTGIPKRLKNKPAIVGYSILTFLIVNFSWVLFGSQNLHAAVYQLGVMLGIGAAGLYDSYAVFTLSEYLPFYILAVLCSTPLPGKLLKKIPEGIVSDIFQAVAYIGLLLICVSYLVMGAHNPFIYFNF